MPGAPAVPAQPDRPGAPEEQLPSPVSEQNQWRYILVHHSAGPSGNAASFDRAHRSKGWDGVAYHFVITNGKGGVDGGLEVSPRWEAQKHGAHAGGMPATVPPETRNSYNEFGIGICLVGNFEHRAPSRAQMKTLAKLITRLRNQFDIPIENVMGHRHVKSTACPGGRFPWGTLFAMTGHPHPHHLQRRMLLGTEERCPWCFRQSDVARDPYPQNDAASIAPPTILNGSGR
ncbi:MAG: to N-acetylmuramoyl-L-alanine amidase lysozyme [Armatimonadetes bacterium]|jgi:N-acetyl-anhydromuramyl-L-alanine amidase AmpD|nr:to N-acetylmuramoyl-L-alanine amidase lysozyme [Armatimonadota bacterium]